MTQKIILGIFIMILLYFIILIVITKRNINIDCDGKLELICGEGGCEYYCMPLPI